MQPREPYAKRIRDPIYGYVDVTEQQLKVMGLDAFQRLRRISQLSFADMVYPNATHKRFAHSLGCMHLARMANQRLRESEIGEQLDLNDTDYNAIEWAALLHDVGHLPFSHVSEPAFAFFVGKLDSWKEYHAVLSKKIINDEKLGITAILGSELRAKVVALLDDNARKTPKLVKDVISGPCSVDRLDYLRRDAYHAGTPEYAIIDYDRILTSIAYYPGDRYMSPVFKEKSLYVLEGAILSYFYMYRAIYYHHAVRAACLLFRDILWDAFENHDLANDLRPVFDPDVWQYFDDYRLMSLLLSKQELLPRLKALLFRHFPKRVKDITDQNKRRIASFIEKNKYSEKTLKEKERAVADTLRKKYKSLEVCLLDSPIVIPYPRSSFASNVIYLWDGTAGHEPELIARKAPHLPRLPDAAEQQMAARVYVHPASLTQNPKFVEGLNSVIMETFK